MTFQNTFQRVNCSDSAVNNILAELPKNKVLSDSLNSWVMLVRANCNAVHYSHSAEDINKCFREF